MKKLMLVFIIALLSVAVGAHAQEEKTKEGKKAEEKKAAGEVTIVGEIIDSQCYLSMGAKGDEHRQCAVDCIKGGLPPAILEEKSGNVYFIGNGKDSMKGSNELVAAYAAQKASIKGKLAERGGAKMIIMKSIEAVK